jgi:hypothetical protein
VTSIIVTIADPRPPTAELTLVSPPWAAPNTTVLVNGTAVSLLGSNVGGAIVTITWSVQAAEIPVDVYQVTSVPASSMATGSVPNLALLVHV